MVQDTTRRDDPFVSLDDLLTRLIAAQEGIRPEEVTTEYIHEQREARIYPAAKPNNGTTYGGYHAGRLRVFSRAEIDQLERDAEEKLREIGASE
jgi:hypothetical protein